MENDFILKCDNISIGYGDNVVIKELSFEIAQGDFIVITGENGTGKSTLIKSILGLVKPISGEIILKSDKKIGYLPQQSDAQKDFPATVYEIVLSGFANNLGLRPFYSAAEKKAALENIVKMNLAEYARSAFSELSGGQRQRALIARMLCATGKIAFLDEPTSGLDSASQEHFYNIISEINRSGVTIVMVSHDKKVSEFANCTLLLGSKWHFDKKGVQGL